MTSWLSEVVQPGWATVAVAIAFAVVAMAFVSTGPIARVKVAAGSPVPEAKPFYGRDHFVRFLAGKLYAGMEIDREPVPPIYRKALRWDLAFPLVYVPSLMLLLDGTLAVALARPASGRWLLVLPVVAGLADWTENLLLLRAVGRGEALDDPHEPCFTLSRIATGTKWLATYTTVALIGSGAVALAVVGAEGWAPPPELGSLLLVAIGLSLYQPAQLLLFRRLPGLWRRTAAAAMNVGAGLITVWGLGPLFDVGLRQMTEGGGDFWFSLRPWPVWAVGMALVLVTGVAVAYRFPALRARMADARYARLGTLGLGWSAVLIAVGTAGFEELVFRGFLLEAWKDAGLGMPLAVTASSVLFGLWHIGPALDRTQANVADARPDEQGSAVASTVAFTALAGVAFCGLRLATGNIYAGVVLHAAINIASMVAAWFATRADARATPSAGTAGPYPVRSR